MLQLQLNNQTLWVFQFQFYLGNVVLLVSLLRLNSHIFLMSQFASNNCILLVSQFWWNNYILLLPHFRFSIQCLGDWSTVHQSTPSQHFLPHAWKSITSTLALIICHPARLVIIFGISVGSVQTLGWWGTALAAILRLLLLLFLITMLSSSVSSSAPSSLYSSPFLLARFSLFPLRTLLDFSFLSLSLFSSSLDWLYHFPIPIYAWAIASSFQPSFLIYIQTIIQTWSCIWNRRRLLPILKLRSQKLTWGNELLPR